MSTQSTTDTTSTRNGEFTEGQVKGFVLVMVWVVLAGLWKSVEVIGEIGHAIRLFAGWLVG